MASIAIPAVLQPLVDIQTAAEMTAQFLYAGAAIFLFDWFLTLPDEIEFIWLSSWSAIKTLFLVNRYGTALTILALIVGDGGTKANSALGCKILYISAGIAMSTLFIIWNWILAIRVHALYGLNERVKYILIFLWIGTSASTFALTVNQMTQISKNITSIRDLKVCLPEVLPARYYSIWVPGVAYETILFSMTMGKLYMMTRHRTSKTSLHNLLLRDGTLNYAVLTSARIVNLVMYIRKDPLNIYMVLFLTIGLGSTLVSRMVLNLKTWNRIPDYPNLDGPTHFGVPGIGVGVPGVGRSFATHSRRHMGTDMFELATRRTTGLAGQRSSHFHTDTGTGTTRSMLTDEDDIIAGNGTGNGNGSTLEHSRSVHIEIGGRPTYRRQATPAHVLQARGGVVVERDVTTTTDVDVDIDIGGIVRSGRRSRTKQDLESFDDDSDDEVDRDRKTRPLDSLKDFFGPSGPQPPTS